MMTFKMSDSDRMITICNLSADTDEFIGKSDGFIPAYTGSALATQQKRELLALASSKIEPLQDAVELGIATEEETALLLGWKKYRVKLGRIDPGDAPDINWPDKPE